VVKQYRDVMAFMDEAAHSSSIRSKLRGTNPVVIRNVLYRALRSVVNNSKMRLSSYQKPLFFYLYFWVGFVISHLDSSNE
jgi:hypothetical protein